MSKATDRVAAIARKSGSSAHPLPIKTARKIVGVPTEQEQTKALEKAKTKPRGGKPGSAVASQSAEYEPGAITGKRTPAQHKAADSAMTAVRKGLEAKEAKAAPKASPDKITAVNPTRSGPGHIAVDAGSRTVLVPQQRFVGELTKIAIVGGSLKAVEAYLAAHKPAAKLANGITGHDAPHSAQAAADSRKGNSGKVTPEPKVASAASKAKLPAKTSADRAYTVINRDHGARAGSKRAIQLEIVFKHGNTAKARAAGAESVDIKFAADKGFIKFN